MFFVFLVIIIPLFFLSAFFSSSETVLFSITPLQLRKLREADKSVGDDIAVWQREPARVLSTILAGNTLVNFAIASLGYRLIACALPEYAGVITVPVFTVLLLVLGEIFPKQYALRNAERLAIPCVKLLRKAMILLKPLSFVMTKSTHVFDDFLSRERRALSDDELRTVVEGAAASGVIDGEEASMVEGVMRLPDLYALNEMTPRVRLVGVETTMTDDEKFELAKSSDWPYLPVYRKDMDHIEGFLDVESFLADPSRHAETWIASPLKVSETDGLDDILVLFVKTGRRIAVVEDRWGGTAGIITRGDILELFVKPVDDAPVSPRAGSRVITGRRTK